MIQRLTIVAVLLLLVPVAWVLGSARALSQPATLRVVATTTQIQDFVRNVAGDRAAMIPVLGPDEDAHDYQPTAADARSIAEADLILANGVGLEPWLDRLAQNARPGVRVVKLGEQSGITVRAGGASGDPHVWFDPTNVQKMVGTIVTELSAVDPAGAESFTANGARYTAELDDLDREIQALWAAVPENQRRLVTNHDAFGYYVDRYGLVFVGSIMNSLSTEAEPSAADLQRLIQAIRIQRVRSIFTESSLNPRLAQQISQQAAVRIYSNLYSDSLGRPGSEGDTYIKMMRFNTRTMIDGMTR